MDFYYRVFAANDKKFWLPEIEKFLEENELGLTALGVADEEDENDLEAEPVQIVFVDAKDREVAVLEYDLKAESELLPEEIDEFLEIVQEMRPERNRAWVVDQLQKTVACYAFTVLQAGFEENNWDDLATLAAWFREETNGIEQSDGGQITNKDGAIVLIDATDEEDESDWYECPVALRDGDAWIEKEIDSAKEFAAFLDGNV